MSTQADNVCDNARQETDPVDTDRQNQRAVMRHAWMTLSVVAFASMMSGMSASALNVALPTVVRHFDASSVAASWILLAYMLANATLLLGFGRLADMFGRRGMYLLGLALYTVASALCGLAPNEWWLVAFRVLQATGGALLLANSAALVTAAFPRARLGEGMGIYLASFSIAQLFGPTLGGFLAEMAGWQWVFWFNVPIGVLCLTWGAFFLKSTPGERRREQRLDVRGNILVLVILTSGLAALSQATALGWSHPLVVGGLILCGALIPVFVWAERRVVDPLIDFRLFRDLSFGFGLMGSFLNSMSQIGLVLLMSLYFQAAMGVNPLRAGVLILPLAIAAVSASLLSGLVQRVITASTLAVIGNLLKIMALVILLLEAGSELNMGMVLVALIFAGLGTGFFMPSNATALMRDLPSERLGIANAMRMLCQSTGVVVGTAAVLAIVTSGLPAELRRFALAGTINDISPTAVSQFIEGYERALIWMTVMAVLTVASTVAARQVRAADAR